MKMLHEGLVWKISTGGASPLRGAGPWRSYSFVKPWLTLRQTCFKFWPRVSHGLTNEKYLNVMLRNKCVNNCGVAVVKFQGVIELNEKSACRCLQIFVVVFMRKVFLSTVLDHLEWPLRLCNSSTYFSNFNWRRFLDTTNDKKTTIDAMQSKGNKDIWRNSTKRSFE